jgi:hypothetical protein
VHIWHLRNPDGGARGLEFAEAQLDPHDVLLAHALPERVDIVVRNDADELVARASGLRADGARPMSRLRLQGRTISRENVWPSDDDIGRPVILPGGEVGILLSWWNADDGSAWRWRVEFSNRISP